jgi:phosphoglycerate dehydrogenase-like enzyme
VSVPEKVNLVLLSGRNQWLERVRAVDPQRLNVSFLTAADFADDRTQFYPPGPLADGTPSTAPAERDRVLREAHVVLLGLPYPTDLLARTQQLQWVHHPNAGTSNLWASDLWGAAVTVTSSRGSNYAGPIAEWVIAGALMFARGLHVGARGSMDARDYTHGVTLAGKTMGIIGLGGIGRNVAALARALGMTVLATRRSAQLNDKQVEGVERVLPASALHDMLPRCDFVAVCVMLTKETTGLLDTAAFAAMKPGAIIINVARGEVIDETALAAALSDGRLGGACLDVYAGELSGAPPPTTLTHDPRVVITPHVSAVSDQPGPVGIDLFVENLRKYLDGRPLRNVIDWDRGY